MAITRLGVCGPSAAYPGFSAKEELSQLAATADFLVQVPADDLTVTIPADDCTVQIPADDTTGEM